MAVDGCSTLEAVDEAVETVAGKAAAVKGVSDLVVNGEFVGEDSIGETVRGAPDEAADADSNSKLDDKF